MLAHARFLTDLRFYLASWWEPPQVVATVLAFVELITMFLVYMVATEPIDQVLGYWSAVAVSVPLVLTRRYTTATLYELFRY